MFPSSPYYWAHCRTCGEHFETKSGTCPSCRDDEYVIGYDRGAEEGCEDCIYTAQLEEDLEKARAAIARKAGGSR